MSRDATTRATPTISRRTVSRCDAVPDGCAAVAVTGVAGRAVSMGGFGVRAGLGPQDRLAAGLAGPKSL